MIGREGACDRVRRGMLSFFADDVTLLVDQQLRVIAGDERALQSSGYSRRTLDVNAPSLHGRMTSTLPFCDPHGTPSRGEGP